MKAFITHRGVLAPLDRANVDTDQIMAKQFLKLVHRTGFGEHLFEDWRYLPSGKPNPDFVLNQAPYKNASILIARSNFGCGSSREHAVWGVAQYGFRAVIAPSFADIFKNNSSKNGLLTIELSEKEVQTIFDQIAENPGLEATIDLPSSTLMLHTAKPITFPLSVDPVVKERLLKGLDDIGLTLEKESLIRDFEKTHETYVHKP